MAIVRYMVGAMTPHQQRHFARVRMNMLKMELLNYKRARAMGLQLYWDPARLPL